MSKGLRRVYGRNWDDAPQPLRRVVAVIFVTAIVSMVVSVGIVASDDSLAGMAVAAAVFLVLFHAVVVGVAVFLLRGSRLTWLLFVVLSAVAVSRLPDRWWDVLGYVANAITLMLLLAPGAARAVWSGHGAPYVATSDVRRPD